MTPPPAPWQPAGTAAPTADPASTAALIAETALCTQPLEEGGATVIYWKREGLHWRREGYSDTLEEGGATLKEGGATVIHILPNSIISRELR